MDENFQLSQIGVVAKKFLSHLGNTKVVKFYGEMGAGKTTFIEKLCEALGVMETMSSPTFSIINQYACTDGAVIYHIDLYRLNSEKEAVGAGVEDCLYSDSYCFVEWPDKAPGIFPENTASAYLSTLEDGLRNIQLKL